MMRRNQTRIGNGRHGEPQAGGPDSPSARADKAGHKAGSRREPPRARRGPIDVEPTSRGPRKGKDAKSATAPKLLTHKDLDQQLDALAVHPDTFAAGCAALAAELDRSGTGLEITDPLTWRKSPAPGKAQARVTLAQQFRSEVDAMIILPREPEARLARRIE